MKNFIKQAVGAYKSTNIAKQNNKLADKIEASTKQKLADKKATKALDEYYNRTGQIHKMSNPPSDTRPKVWYWTTNDVGERIKLYGVPPIKINK